MKGKVSEILIVCGTYLYTHSVMLGSGLLILGIFCGFFRFVLETEDKRVKNDIITGFHNIVSSISKAANSLEQQITHEKQQTIH